MLITRQPLAKHQSTRLHLPVQSCSALLTCIENGRDTLCGECVVAAIDFGTTYSGYAFSFRHDFIKDKTKIFTNNWVCQDATLLSHKVPTTVLLDENKQFLAFGYEAEAQYAKMSEEDTHDTYYYFKDFKMQLYDKKTIGEDFELKDATGKAMRAIDVFSSVILFFKDEVLHKCKGKLREIEESDFRWVLTVPAIWNESAKKFMRKAAEMAGLDNLVLCLEPEAASIFCRHIPTTKEEAGPRNPFQPKSRYMIVDAGGGTIDITVHEVNEDGSIKELVAASGGAWGGNLVNQNFFKFLDKICGSNYMETLKKENMEDYLDLSARFEVKKRSKIENKTTIQLPYDSPIDEIRKNLEDTESKVDKGKLRLTRSVIDSCFDGPCTATVDHVRKTLQDIDGVRAMFMVGGFSESNKLQTAMKTAFPAKAFIFPQDTGLVVLKGAVLFGHDPMVISERRCRFTYGVATTSKFVEGRHPESKRRIKCYGSICDNIFDKHVRFGQQVKNGETQVSRKYVPIQGKSPDNVVLRFYYSSDADPIFVTDRSCHKIGELRVDVKGVSADRVVAVSFRFGGTELEVDAVVVATSKTLKTSFKLLD